MRPGRWPRPLHRRCLMRVLVTGAAGRMGAHLTRLLTGDGHIVRAFVLPDDPNNQEIDGPNVEIVPGRLEDAAAVGRPWTASTRSSRWPAR